MTGDPWWVKCALLFTGGLLGLVAKVFSDWFTVFVWGPKLELSFSQGEDCATLTPEEYDVSAGPSAVTVHKGSRFVFFARVRVTNTKPRIATKCQAWLVNVELQDEQGRFAPTIFKDSIPLIWSYNAEAETVDIAQGINRYVDLVRVQDDIPGVQPQLRSHSGQVLFPYRYDPLFQGNGTYRLTVLVSAQDVKPHQIKVVVKRGEQWPPKAELST